MVRILQLILACSLLLISTPLDAQEATPASEGWQVTERCLGELPYPTIPQSQWDFEGVIFSRNDEGIHALRSDMETPYFVVSADSELYVEVGSFSPDGRWFAYPAGDSWYDTQSFNEWNPVDYIEITSTTLPQERFRVEPWNLLVTGGPRSLPRIQWLGSDHILYPAESIHLGGIVNAFSGQLDEWTNDVWLGWLSNFSPDFSHAFYFNSDDRTLSLYDVENDTQTSDFQLPDGQYLSPVWLPDSSGFVMETLLNSGSNQLDALALFENSGSLEEIISLLGGYQAAAFSPDISHLVFRARGQLYLADMERRVVEDMCFRIETTSAFPQIVWSPDSTYLAFTYDSYPVILNTETLEMQILRYETGEIIGWYPLP